MEPFDLWQSQVPCLDNYYTRWRTKPLAQFLLLFLILFCFPHKGWVCTNASRTSHRQSLRAAQSGCGTHGILVDALLPIPSVPPSHNPMPAVHLLSTGPNGRGRWRVWAALHLSKGARVRLLTAKVAVDHSPLYCSTLFSDLMHAFCTGISKALECEAGAEGTKECFLKHFFWKIIISVRHKNNVELL